MKLKRILTLLLFCVGLSCCNPFTKKSTLESMQDRGFLLLGTMNSTLTYSTDGDKTSGIDYELAKKFAKDLNLPLKVRVFPTLEKLFNALDRNEVDFIGAGLTLTEKRKEKYRSSPPYYYMTQKLVYRKGTHRPRKIADLTEPVHVLKDSSHEERLSDLQKKNPTLEIISEDNDQEGLLAMIERREIRFAIVDSTSLAQNQRFYPNLAEAFTVDKKAPVSWFIRKDQYDTFYSAMIAFMGKVHSDSTLARIEEKYFGHVRHFDYVDTRVFLKRIKSKLPRYERLFKKYATKDIDWLLLASVSYQESHWNPLATSPTGVRGMMMLTHDTAKFVGIKNRLDTEQSIKGGAKYLAMQIKRLPDSIPHGEKVWFALACYNIGYGHLMDARRITKMRKQNPNSWADVKANLPLLHQRRWNQHTRYGYARGREAQHYVNNIRQYLSSLTRYVQEQEKAAAEKKAAIDAKLKLEVKLKAKKEKEAKEQLEKEETEKAEK
ncbi:MAG TPA: membrane-bound lytic murein transglycosylase MltF [Psychromonas hadalis]|nr:membrane-bound lytic murein transglycosylase MltF [Psychromonas hadalis]